MICFISLIAFCVITDVMCIFFGQKSGQYSKVVRGLSVLSLLVLSLVLAMINSISNTFVIFLCLALAFFMLAQTTQEYNIVSGLLKIVSSALLAVCAYSIAQFNLWGLLGGAGLGAAFGFLGFAFKKDKKSDHAFAFFDLLFVGIAIGFVVSGILLLHHSVTRILTLAGLGLVFVKKIQTALSAKSEKIDLIFEEIELVGLLLIACSIYLY